MHILGSDRARFERAVGKKHAAVYVRVVARDTLQLACPPRVEFPIGALKADALIVLLPKTIKVLDPDGKIIKPSRQFYITTESFDPWHLLTDME